MLFRLLRIEDEQVEQMSEQKVVKPFNLYTKVSVSGVLRSASVRTFFRSLAESLDLCNDSGYQSPALGLVLLG